MNFMFLYNFASLMLAILCLEYGLSDSLGHKNPRNALEWKNLLKTGERGLLPSAMRMWRWAYVCSFDFVYVGLTLRTWATNQKNPNRLT